MSKTLLEDNAAGGAAAWDMGTGEEHGQPQQAQPASGSPAPTASPWRHTHTPQPKATHGGIVDAGGVKDGTTPTEDFGKDFPAAFDETFPDDLAKSYVILRAVRALPERNKKQAAEKARRAGLISAHIRKISNTSPAIHIGADEAAALQQARNARPLWMAARLDELVKYLASSITAEQAAEPGTLLDNDTPSEARQKLSADPKLRLCRHPAVLQWLQIAKRFACDAEKFSIQNHDVIYPADHIRLLEHELHASQSPERIRTLLGEISRVKQSATAGTTEVSLKGLAAAMWVPVFETLRSAITVSQLLVAQWEMDAILVEQEFFGEFAIERHQTFLSKRFSDLRAELEKLTANKTTFAWFGVNDIAESDE